MNNISNNQHDKNDNKNYNMNRDKYYCYHCFKYYKKYNSKKGKIHQQHYYYYYHCLHNHHPYFNKDLTIPIVQKYGISIYLNKIKSMDKKIKSSFKRIKLSITGQGYISCYDGGEIRIKDLKDIKYGLIEYHDDDLIQYLSFLFNLNNNLFLKYLNTKVKNINLKDIDSSFSQFSFKSYFYVIFENNYKPLDNFSNCLVISESQDKQYIIYHINNGLIYSYIIEGNYWNNLYIKNEKLKNYEWVHYDKKNRYYKKYDNNVENIDGNKKKKKKIKKNIYLKHGPFIFSKLEGKISSLYEKYYIIKSFD